MLSRLRYFRSAIVGSIGIVSSVACSAGGDASSANDSALSSPGCDVTYSVSQWDGGFVANVAVKNGGTPLKGWNVSWDFAGDQHIDSLWSGKVAQTGAHVEVSNESWNGDVPAGGTASFGFNASFKGTNAKPTDIKVNGVTCGGAANPTPKPSPDPGTNPSPNPDPGPAPGDKRVIGYYTAWATYGRNYQISDVPAQKLTHINYAFANVNDANECVVGDSYADTDKAFPGDTWDPGAKRGNFHQLELLKQKNPKLQTLISIGGWTWSGKISNAAATAASRQHFAKSCIDFAQKFGFDGIDIDWEYPVGGGLAGNANRPEDKENYVALLAEFRSQFNALGDGKHHLLTIAAPAGPAIMDHLDMKGMAAYLDWFNVMTYDFHGGWEAKTGHNAPLYAPAGDKSKFDVDSAVLGYMAGGVPAAKIVMGVPFYGRGWSGVAATNNGLEQGASGAPTGSWEAGVFDWKDLANNYVGKGDFKRYWDDSAKVPWLYSPSKQVMITYDDEESMGLKADYIKSKSLGGAMFWELSGDNGGLLDTLNKRLR
jgi:chitinase